MDVLESSGCASCNLDYFVKKPIKQDSNDLQSQKETMHTWPNNSKNKLTNAVDVTGKSQRGKQASKEDFSASRYQYHAVHG